VYLVILNNFGTQSLKALRQIVPRTPRDPPGKSIKHYS